MKIAQVAPVFRGVSHAHTMNVHRSLHDLTEALIFQGHQVRIVTGFERSLDDFDIVHYHVEHPKELTFGLSSPDVCTVYGNVQGAAQPSDSFGTTWVAISKSQVEQTPDVYWSQVICRGLPRRLYEPAIRRGAYIAHLCTGGSDEDRLSLKRARHLAAATRTPLVVGVDPIVSESRARWLNEESGGIQVRKLDARSRETFFQQALALVLPTDGHVPGDIATLEAMSCGTPVIAWQGSRGAELIEHGKTGFVVDTGAEAARALNSISSIDRGKVADTFETQLCTEGAASAYLEIYRELLTQKKRGRSTRGSSEAA